MRQMLTATCTYHDTSIIKPVALTDHSLSTRPLRTVTSIPGHDISRLALRSTGLNTERCTGPAQGAQVSFKIHSKGFSGHSVNTLTLGKGIERAEQPGGKKTERQNGATICITTMRVFRQLNIAYLF